MHMACYRVRRGEGNACFFLHCVIIDRGVHESRVVICWASDSRQPMVVGTAPLNECLYIVHQHVAKRGEKTISLGVVDGVVCYLSVM